MKARFSVPSRAARGPPSLLYDGYWLFPGGRVWLKRGAEHSFLVMELHLHLPSLPA